MRVKNKEKSRKQWNKRKYYKERNYRTEVISDNFGVGLLGSKIISHNIMLTAMKDQLNCINYCEICSRQKNYTSESTTRSKQTSIGDW